MVFCKKMGFLVKCFFGMIKKDAPIILSLGGSLIVPNGGINTKFLKEFNKFIRKKVAEGRRFFIVAGGGSTTRHYQGAGKEILGRITKDDLDWLGIHATRLNAHLLRTIFKDIAHPRIIDHYDEQYPRLVETVVIAAGWKPGWSTDYDAVLLARDYGATTVINLSNVEMVYTKDPRKFADAQPIEKTSWPYFRDLVGRRWTPGMNVPWDPIAAGEAEKIGLTVIILKGDDLTNLERLFSGNKFKGTVITPFRLDASFYDREYFEGEKGELISASCFKGWFYTFFSKLYRALCIRLFLRPKTVLDVGCGLGNMVYYLRLMGVEAYGVEISKYALKKAHPKIKKYVKYGGISRLPFEDKSFDLVTSFDVLEHIETEKLEKAVKECNRVAKRYVLHKIFSTENWWIKKFHGPDISHVSVFGKDWWKSFFKKLGLKRSKKSYLYLPHFIETLFLLERKS